MYRQSWRLTFCPSTRNATHLQVVGCRSGRATITLFPGALHALREIHQGVHAGMRCATASSADTPRAVAIGLAALGILEVVPGITVLEVLSKGWPDGFDGHLQIGRTPPLSSDKSATHFPILQKETGISYVASLSLTSIASNRCGGCAYVHCTAQVHMFVIFQRNLVIFSTS